ncbi:secreted RxLR effector protein 161-like [Lathyrus oleraceus]|uniref:secreted RxLR effector protein 161-like n=1 Tax=Pisum sativum TaxID=3888 RepID=UPI0021CE891A|nr:secreted RxLR effector protein 161-like [Pisum sativum]
MEKSQECHLTAVKRVLRYIKGRIDHGMLMPRQKKTNTYAEVYGYTNSDSNGDHNEKKSIASYIFTIEYAPISWSSRKKSIVALSSCESELRQLAMNGGIAHGVKLTKLYNTNSIPHVDKVFDLHNFSQHICKLLLSTIVHYL